MQEAHFCHIGNLNLCTCVTNASLCWEIMLKMMFSVINYIEIVNDWFDFYGLLNVRNYAVCE